MALNQLLFTSQPCLKPLSLMRLNPSNLLDQFFNNRSSRYLKIGLRLTSWPSLHNWEIWLINTILNLLSQSTWDQMHPTPTIRFFKALSKLISMTRLCPIVKEPTTHQISWSFSRVSFLSIPKLLLVLQRWSQTEMVEMSLKLLSIKSFKYSLKMEEFKKLLLFSLMLWPKTDQMKDTFKPRCSKLTSWAHPMLLKVSSNLTDLHTTTEKESLDFVNKLVSTEELFRTTLVCLMLRESCWTLMLSPKKFWLNTLEN